MSSYYGCLELLEDSDSDLELDIIEAFAREELERLKNKKTGHDGSVRGLAYYDRNKSEGHKRLFADYFAETPVYPPQIFRRRFRMRRELFCKIHDAIVAHDLYIVQRPDGTNKICCSSLQKVVAAFRMLAYGVAADSVDEYVRMGESMIIESLKKFVKVVVSVFSEEYLKSPNEEDIARLLHIGEQRGFPGMLGSNDCMHWRWRNCSAGWKVQYTGHTHEPTVILEGVASYDLWIWHAFFGLPGSLNDINVLERSPVFTELAEGRAPNVNYTINGHNCTTGYYLADGIYPPWETFVKTIPSPQGNKRKHFSAAQESARKDVERAFGVLQARFAIICGPTRLWDISTLKDIMKACIIMHSMIIDERDLNISDFNYKSSGDSSQST